MKTTIFKGKVCNTYDKNQLQRIIDYLGITLKISQKKNRNEICKAVELQLRRFDLNKKDGKKWFYNLEEWIIKQNELKI